MNRTFTHPYNENEHGVKFVPNPLYAQSDVLWTQPSEVTVVVSSSQTTRNTRSFSSFVGVSFFGTEARSIVASFAEAVLVLQQAVDVFNKVNYTSSFKQEQSAPDLEYDEWVDMPPRVTQKVVMKARFAGRGEPLALLDSFARFFMRVGLPKDIPPFR